jgi:uncharacterized lipoprotein YmbA
MRICADMGLFILLILLSSGCSLGGKRTYSVKQYLLEYPPPVMGKWVQANELARVDRFFVDQAFNSRSMIYREGPFHYQTDPYNQWRVNPGDMVSDYLARDLRKANLFCGVYSHSDMEPTRFILDGRVEEFMGFSDQDGAKVALALSVTFLDLARREVPERVVFQRGYRYTELLAERTPAGFAQAMSKAMEKFSRQLIIDLSKAVSESKK